jgi:hypothetical protein
VASAAAFHERVIIVSDEGAAATPVGAAGTGAASAGRVALVSVGADSLPAWSTATTW